MNTTRPFSADTNKLAYAQAFSRSMTGQSHRASHGRLRSLTLRLRKSA